MKKIIIAMVVPALLLSGCSSSKKDEEKAKQEQIQRENEKIKANTDAAQKSKFSQGSGVDYSISSEKEQVVKLVYLTKKNDQGKRKIQWDTITPKEYQVIGKADDENNIITYRFGNLKENINYKFKVETKDVESNKILDSKEINISNNDEITISVNNDGKITHKKK